MERKYKAKFKTCSVFESLCNVPEFSGSAKFRTWMFNFYENTLRLHILFGDFMFIESMTELSSSRTSFKTLIYSFVKHLWTVYILPGPVLEGDSTEINKVARVLLLWG